MRKFILLAVLLLATLAGVTWWWQQRNVTASGDIVVYGNVETRQVSLAFDGAGRVLALLAEEGDRVRKGDVLARLDTRLIELEARQAEAGIAAQQQNLQKLKNGARPEEIAQAEAQLASARAAADRARADLARIEQLHAGGSASTQMRDHARSESEAAAARLAEAQAALHLIRAGAREEDLLAAEAQLAAAEAGLALIRHRIEQGTLRAPVDALVRARMVEPGDQAGPQRPVYALAIDRPKWIRVHVTEPDLGRVREGMAAAVYTDTDPGDPVSGRVGYISSVAEFTPRAVQTEELRTSLVYEMRVIVDDEADRLRLGQPVTVRIPAGEGQ